MLFRATGSLSRRRSSSHPPFNGARRHHRCRLCTTFRQKVSDGVHPVIRVATYPSMCSSGATCVAVDEPLDVAVIITALYACNTSCSAKSVQPEQCFNQSMHLASVVRSTGGTHVEISVCRGLHWSTSFHLWFVPWRGYAVIAANPTHTGVSVVIHEQNHL